MVMVAVFVAAAIVGILLSLTGKAFVLVPATLLAVGAIIAAVHQTTGVMAFTALGTAVLLQIGYIIGCIVGRVVRARRQRQSDHIPFRR
jgi:hypothetical protein